MSSSFNDKSCLIIIPARKGSKRVLKKNVKHLNNKPLIEYSLEQCKKIKNVEILVSTNDQNILDICKKNNKMCGIHIIENNPKELEKRKKEGYKFIAYSLDTFILRSYQI